MGVHDWAVDGGVFVVAPVRRRVRLETGAAATLAGALCVAATIVNPYALPLGLAMTLPLVLLTYVSSKHRRFRLTVRDAQLKFESATWRQAGAWVPRGECPAPDICEVGYYQSPATTRIALRFRERPAVVVVDAHMSPQRTESLAAAIAEALGVPVQAWSWTEIAAAHR